MNRRGGHLCGARALALAPGTAGLWGAPVCLRARVKGSLVGVLMGLLLGDAAVAADPALLEAPMQPITQSSQNAEASSDDEALIGLPVIPAARAPGDAVGALRVGPEFPCRTTLGLILRDIWFENGVGAGSLALLIPAVKQFYAALSGCGARTAVSVAKMARSWSRRWLSS